MTLRACVRPSSVPAGWSLLVSLLNGAPPRSRAANSSARRISIFNLTSTHACGLLMEALGRLNAATYSSMVREQHDRSAVSESSPVECAHASIGMAPYKQRGQVLYVK